jgi:STE24 endopeptidase
MMTREPGIESKTKRYRRAKTRLWLANLALSFAFLFLLVASGLSSYLGDLSMSLSGNYYVSFALYLTFLAAIFYILFFPLRAYEGFMLEHKFSLSTQTFSAWIRRDLKASALSFLFGLVLFECIYFFLRNFPETWWVFAATIWVGLSIILAKIFPVLIVPLFFKYRPIEDENLKRRLLSLAQSCQVKVMDIFGLDLSRETKKANAALLGLGRGRRIVLSDTLISRYSPEEIEVVLAHELGHFRLLHIWKHLLFGAICGYFVFYAAGITLRKLITFFGFLDISSMAAFPLFLLVLLSASFILLPFQNSFSRLLERQADRFALRVTGLKDSFISMMEKLAQQNLSDPNPSLLEEIFLYDHPPVSKRIRQAEQFSLISDLETK